jgi:hypothetical protein
LAFFSILLKSLVGIKWRRIRVFCRAPEWGVNAKSLDPSVEHFGVGVGHSAQVGIGMIGVRCPVDGFAPDIRK